VITATKSVFLIMYLWHTAGGGNSAVGGPAMTVVPMPSLVVCEKVGAVAKTFADQRVTKGDWNTYHASLPAEYRCIEVDDTVTQQQQQTRCAP
jgi:hypothetical protein